MQLRKWERSQDTKTEREQNGVFRCQRCATLRPLPWITQDGFNLCRTCVDSISVQEQSAYLAAAKERGGEEPMTPLPIPVISPLTSVSSVTAMTPSSLNLKRGGASGSVILTGVNFTASNSVTTNAANVTASVSLDSSSQITVTLTAGVGATPGDYNLLFNGDVLTPRRLLKVR